MKVFITGATGFIGIPVTKELIANGHKVLGMSRSDAGAESLRAIGAEVHRGNIEDFDSIRSGAKDADAAIHLAFDHSAFGQGFEKFVESCENDRLAIETLGEIFAGTERPLLVTSGLAGITQGKVATEDDDISPDLPTPRKSEQTALSLVSKDVNASVIRLPQVHDAEKQGLITYLVSVAREKGVSAYVGEGENRWAAGHVSDVAKLYRLALEKGVAGAKYHAVAEEGVRMRDIAETIGRALNITTQSIKPEEAQDRFGWLAMFAGSDLRGSSDITRKKLGWIPTGPGLIADLENMS